LASNKRILNPIALTAGNNNSHRDLLTATYNYNIKASKTLIPYDYTYDRTQFNPFMEGFNIGIGRKSGEYDPQMFKFTIQIYQNFYQVENDLSYCSKLDFPNELYEELDFAGVEYLLWSKYYESLFLREIINMEDLMLVY